MTTLQIVEILVRIAWLAGAVAFVIGLSRMNSPATARNGNLVSAGGMAIAIGATAVLILTEQLTGDGISAVVWATGYRRAYPWLHLPILDDHGEIRQHRGVTPIDGVYVLGQRFQHRRRSNFLDGVGLDAELVADHLANRDLARSH